MSGRPIGGPRFGAAATVVVAGAVLIGGCAIPTPSPGPAHPSALVDPTSSTTPTASIAPTSPTPAASVTARAIAVDPGLLDVLPSSVAGIPVTADPDTAAEIASDPTLAADVDALALAAVFGPLASDEGGGDYAVATVVHLRPETFSDGFYRAWRDTFDAGVCEQAGGVDGHAQTELDGRTVWIGTCTGGVHTYHATLRDDSIIVSLQSAGPMRLGEQIMAGLTE